MGLFPYFSNQHFSRAKKAHKLFLDTKTRPDNNTITTLHLCNTSRLKLSPGKESEAQRVSFEPWKPLSWFTLSIRGKWSKRRHGRRKGDSRGRGSPRLLQRVSVAILTVWERIQSLLPAPFWREIYCTIKKGTRNLTSRETHMKSPSTFSATTRNLSRLCNKVTCLFFT